MEEIAKQLQQTIPTTESLYRTRWLMAHNRLHAIVHQDELAKLDQIKRQWRKYLAELKTAEDVASRPA